MLTKFFSGFYSLLHHFVSFSHISRRKLFFGVIGLGGASITGVATSCNWERAGTTGDDTTTVAVALVFAIEGGTFTGTGRVTFGEMMTTGFTIGALDGSAEGLSTTVTPGTFTVVVAGGTTGVTTGAGVTDGPPVDTGDGVLERLPSG